MSKEIKVKKLTIDKTQLELAEFKARRLGLNFQEYIKFLITKDTEKVVNEDLSKDESIKHKIAKDVLQKLNRKWDDN